MSKVGETISVGLVKISAGRVKILVGLAEDNSKNRVFDKIYLDISI